MPRQHGARKAACGPFCREGCGRIAPRKGAKVLGWVNRSQELGLRELHRRVSGVDPLAAGASGGMVWRDDRWRHYTSSSSERLQARHATNSSSPPCYLHWGPFPGQRDNDVDGGLLHMMMSIGCALNEAFALNRTLLLPAQICVPANHRSTGFFSRREHTDCSPTAELLDLELLSQLAPVAIYDAFHSLVAIPPSNVAWINNNCPTHLAAQHYTCAGGAWLLRRANLGGGYLFDRCLNGQTTTSTQLVDRAFARFGTSLRETWMVGGAKPSFPWWEKRASFTMLLQRGWFWSRALKAAAAAIRSQMGESFVSVHVRRGDRLGKQSRIANWKAASPGELTSAGAIFKQLARWFPAGTVVMISSNEPREFFEVAAASSAFRVFFADDFQAHLTAAGIKNNNQLFALETILFQGAASHVETFEGDTLKGRMACAFIHWIENATSCAGRPAGATIKIDGGALAISLRCAETGRARVTEVNGVREGACPDLAGVASGDSPCGNRGLWLVGQQGNNSRCSYNVLTNGRRLHAREAPDGGMAGPAEMARGKLTSNVECHGTRLRLFPNGSAAQRAAAQLVHEGIVAPALGAISLVHYWRQLDRPRRVGNAALCRKETAWHVLTFGSHGKYERAAAALCRHVLRSGADSCSTSTLNDLPADWREINGVTNTTKGLGHWKWKPFIILRRLRELADGEILLYVDRDLRLGHDLSALFCLGQNAAKGMACFHQACYTERPWTSRELVTAAGAGPAELDSVQINGGLQVWRRSSAALGLAEKYLEWTERFARDPADRSNEDQSFRAHRHDQSCFSLLAKKAGVQSFPWPIRAHDRRDVWAWEAGYCSPSFVFPFDAMPNSIDLDYGSEDTSRTKCRVNQGRHPQMVDYHHMQRIKGGSTR